MISSIDIIIILLYIVSILLMGYYFGKSNKNQNDYFLAARHMPWLPVGFSVVATMISANSFVGGPGWGYTEGLYPFMIQFSVPLAVLSVMLFVMPLMYQLKLTSIYEYIELRFGKYTRSLMVLAFLSNSIIQVSSMLFVPSLVLHEITGINIKIIIPLIVIISIAYTLMGGLKAVIWTDFLQLLLMWTGIIVAYVLTFHFMDISPLESLSNLKSSGKLNALDFSFDLSNIHSFYFTLLGGYFMWLKYFGFDQSQAQRLFSSKSMKGLKRSFVISAITGNITYFSFIFLGVLIFQLYHGKTFENTNSIMINMILNYFPVGLVGVILSAIIASAMSSVDSLLNSMTTVYTKDIHEKIFKKSGEILSLKGTMLVSLVFGIIIVGVVFIGFSNTLSSVLSVVGSYISYISGPSCGLFLLGLFSKKVTDKSCFYAALLGFILTFALSKTFGYTWILNPLVGSSITIGLGLFFSVIFKENLLQQREINQNKVENYTVFGMKKKLLASGNINENGVSLLPFAFDKYAYFIIGFFALQVLLLIALGY